MTGRWKAWKTKDRFPKLSTAPWESRQHREIPTFPQPRLFSSLGQKTSHRTGDYGKVGIQNRDSHFPTIAIACGARTKTHLFTTKGGILPLRDTLPFRIILYWNQMSVSVSSFDWKMLVGAALGNG